MRVLVIEDESTTGQNVVALVQACNPGAAVEGPLVSIRESVEWLMNNPQPDLIFMDIQLGDGLSFEIFDELELNVPVVFITAYDQYMLQAFEVNSIGYLMKPVSQEQISKVLDKFKRTQLKTDIAQLLDQLDWTRKHYKQRLLVKRGTRTVVIRVDEIAYFEINNDLTYLVTKEGGKYITDHTLSELEQVLDPNSFFRINRQHIVQMDVIRDIESMGNTLSIRLNKPEGQELNVSQRNVASFRAWLK